jgi:hypothetical protein
MSAVVESAEVDELRADLRKTKRELNETRKRANMFVANVELFIAWLDEEMRRPSNVERGSRVAKAINSLAMSKDMLRLFLGTLPGHERKPKRKRKP